MLGAFWGRDDVDRAEADFESKDVSELAFCVKDGLHGVFGEVQAGGDHVGFEGGRGFIVVGHKSVLVGRLQM